MLFTIYIYIKLVNNYHLLTLLTSLITCTPGSELTNKSQCDINCDYKIKELC